MLDTLLSRLKEEIAIDGTSGSSIDTVWKYAESISSQVAKESGVSITPKIDGPYKAFVWNYIKQEPELSFFEEAVASTQESQANSEDVPMEEQQQEPVSQDQQDIAMIEQQSKEQLEDVAGTKNAPGDNAIDAAPKGAQPETHLLDMLHDAQLKDLSTEANVYLKRKSKAAHKKPASKKKKTKSAPKKKAPKKKKPAKKKKRASAGHSDSDFEMDSDESESEYDESDLSEASSEEYSTEGYDDVSDQDDHPKPDYNRKFPRIRKTEDILSNPRNVQPQTREDNANLTAIQDIGDLSYDQVQERYGSRLRIIASARLQNEQLFLGVPPDANITPSLVVILREIIKTRTKGLYQASITRLLGIDGRSTGHYAKSLEDKGAITRRGVSINSMFTNICVHARYSIESNEVDMNTVGDKEAENELPYNVNGHGRVFSQKTLLDAMVDLALVAPNGLILAQDVLHGLGFNSTRKAVRKWFNRSIDELCIKGYFEKATIRLDGSRHHRCLQLLKVPEDYEARQASDEQTIVPVGELSFPIKIKTTTDHGFPIHHLLCDVPLESQILEVIAAAGTQGAVQKDVSIALNLDEMRCLSKALEKLAELKPGQGYEHYGVVRYIEFEGRIRRYRYFTLAASFMENEGKEYVPPPLPEAETDESKYYERTIFFPVPHNMSELVRYKKMVRKAGHRNVNYMEAPLPRFTKRKSNPDGTPRPKSRYILEKEKKIAAMLAAQKAAAEGSTRTAGPSGTSSSNIAEPSSTATPAPAPTPARKPTNKEIHSFFKQANVRPSDVHLIRPPSPTPPPAPVISQNRLACPASNPKAREAPATEAPAPKKRKYTKKNTANPQKATSVSEAGAATTMQRTTRSGRAIPYQVELETSLTTPSEGSSESPVVCELSDTPVAPDSQGSTQMDASLPASSELVEPEDHAAAEKPEVSTSGNKLQASAPPAKAAQSKIGPKPSSSQAPQKSSLPRLKKKTIADYFKLTPRKPTLSVAVNPPAEASLPASTTPPTKAKEKKTVTFADGIVESEQSSTRAVTEAISATPTLSPEDEVAQVAAEEPTSSGNTEETTITNNDGSTQTDVADMEVDASESIHPATAPDEATENEASATTTRATPSGSATMTPASEEDEEEEAEDDDDQASVATAAEESRLFRRFQHEKFHKPVNSYLETRIKIFCEMLDEMRLVEMGKSLLLDFEERLAAQNKSRKYKMDGKTLWSTALTLEKRGLAQTAIVDCTFLSGKVVQRKVLFHRDMARDSEEYKTYIRFIKERRTGISYRNLPKRVTQVDQVVRLSDQVEQMQKEAQELLVSGQVKKAKQMELRISELSQNLETFGREYGKITNSYWMIEAVQYGWINASMARAKIFHRYLLRLLEANVDGVNQETRVISLTAVCDNMSFQLLAQVIGVFKPTRLIAEFYKDVNNHKVKMADMSEELKRDLFDENTKFLRRLRKLFNMLEYNRILTGQFTEVKNNPNFQATKYAHIAHAYRLEKTVPIIDRKQADEPVLREYTIKTTEDFNEYWADLKYVSTARNTVSPDFKKLDNTYEIEMRSSMHCPRNWSTRSIFTRSQRKLLNEKVDKVNRTTPLHDPHQIRSFAVKFNMPIYAIQAYYVKVDAALERRHLHTKEKKLERLLMGGTKRRQAARTKYNIYRGRRVITVDSNHAFVGTRRKPSKAIKSYMDDLQDLPVVQDDPLKSIVKRRRKRQTWTDQDDDILLYMYTILRHRSRMNKAKLSWVPAQKMFPDREAQTCRHRKDKMLAQSAFSEKHELYLIYWDAFYREGIEKGDITDPNPSDNAYFDVLSYVEYFVKRLQELDENPVDLPLPHTLAQTNEMYEIARHESHSPYFEDVFHDGESLIHKLQSLHQAPFTLRKYTDSHYDQSDAVVAIEDDAAKRLWSLIRIYCLMTLMTPAEVFDPFHAYQILSRFPQQAMDAVFERMKADRTLISASGDRPVPGTRWALSAKFIKDMSGVLPVDLFNQAKEYEKFLATQNEKFKFMPFHASSGMMACLLNALSDNQISFSLTNLNLQLRKVKEVGFKTRGIGNSILTQLGVDIQRNQEDSIMVDVPPVSRVNIKQLSNKEYDATLSNLLISQNDKESALIKAIVHALHEQHDVGLTLYQLKMKLQEHHQDHRHHFSDCDITKTVHKLCYNEPALVCKVGFDAVRYVHIKFVDSWTINNKETKDYVLSEKAKEVVMSETNGQFQIDVVKQDIVVPSLWIDINGNVTDLVLNGCKRAIVDLVLRKPGISEASIHRHMATGLSKREVHDVLDILVEQQALRRIQVEIIPQQQASRPSIFAKKTVVQCSGTESIGRLTHSCFWVTPKIFSSTA